MQGKPEIVRDKHDADILEQVFKGVQTDAPAAANAPQVTDLAVAPTAVGDSTSAVQVQVLAPEDPSHSDD